MAVTHAQLNYEIKKVFEIDILEKKICTVRLPIVAVLHCHSDHFRVT
jgi:hypothetical protein